MSLELTLCCAEATPATVSSAAASDVRSQTCGFIITLPPHWAPDVPRPQLQASDRLGVLSPEPDARHCVTILRRAFLALACRMCHHLRTSTTASTVLVQFGFQSRPLPLPGGVRPGLTPVWPRGVAIIK